MLFFSSVLVLFERGEGHVVPHVLGKYNSHELTSRKQRVEVPGTLNPINPHPKTLNPKPLNPQTLNPKT